MMLIGGGETGQFNPTVQVPPWDSSLEDPMANTHSLYSVSPNGNSNAPFDDFSPLHRYLPSNTNDDDYDALVDAFSCDHFRMFEFKVRKCARGRSHDWTECPYAHPGEKARRRDPRKVHYTGTPCPEFRKGVCKKGDGCEFAHGVFECWLHPSRYRTQPCKDGTQCRRRICFFAHTPDQLRVLPQGSPRNNHGSVAESYDGSPSRLGLDSFGFSKGSFGSSPTSTLYSPPRSPPSGSPPMSPGGSLGPKSVNELASSIRGLQIGKPRLSMSPPSWGSQMGSGFCSPRSPSTLRPGFMSLPSTPTRIPTRSGLGALDLWDQGCEEEPVMERVESGRVLRARIYAKLSKENSLGRVESSTQCPDLGWVSELVK